MKDEQSMNDMTLPKEATTCSVSRMSVVSRFRYKTKNSILLVSEQWSSMDLIVTRAGIKYFLSNETTIGKVLITTSLNQTFDLIKGFVIISKMLPQNGLPPAEKTGFLNVTNPA